ncbi:MAG: hypothetical protein WKI04_01980 [Ferruginibacter sp.]
MSHWPYPAEFYFREVFDEVKNQGNISTREMGYFELKNVKQPVRIYAIANSGIVVPSRDEVRGKQSNPGTAWQFCLL